MVYVYALLKPKSSPILNVAALIYNIDMHEPTRSSYIQ